MKKTGIILLLCSILTVIGGYFVISGGFYSISADESSRTLIAYYWFRSGMIDPMSWLPLHFIIMGIGFQLIPDLILLPRIVSILFGILTIASVAIISNLIFKDSRITILTIVLATFLPQRFILSLIPLPEIIYIFFISAGAYFLYKWISVGNQKDLYYTAVLWSIASALRYEAWLFLICLAGFILLEYSRKYISSYNLFILLVISGIFPFIWMLYNYSHSGDLLWFMNEPVSIFFLKYDSSPADLMQLNPLYQFVEQNIHSLNLAGAAGIYLCRKNKLQTRWLLILFTPLLILSIISLTGKSLPAHNFWRTSAVWSILIIPFTAYTLMEIIKRNKKYKAVQVLTVLMILTQFSLNGSELIRKISVRHTLTNTDVQTGETLIKYLNSSNQEDFRVLVEQIPSYDHFNVVLASQVPYKFIISERNNLVPIRKDKYANTRIDYFLVKSFSKKRALKRNTSMQKMLEFNDWTLFKKNSVLEI